MGLNKSKLSINAHGLSDIGCVRKNNEDKVLVHTDLNLFVVADGVGGAAAGEVASELFVNTCMAEFLEYNGWNKDLRMLISRCFHQGNHKLREHMESHQETKGMGCTAEVLTFDNHYYYLGHVGDSRTYLIRDHHIQLITKDHSFVQEQIDLGLIQPEEADSHWLKNTIYRAVGSEDDIEVDLLQGRLHDGDIFLLCSDGLSDVVAQETLYELSAAPEQLETRVTRLIDAAKSRGGKDNISALLCEVSVQSFRQKIQEFLDQPWGFLKR